MSGSSFGKIFTVTTYGESHGRGIGVVVDGCPSGIELNEEIVQIDLDKRKPGTSKYVTQRKESDVVEILSGVFEGKTTGTPISMLIRNEDERSKDYGDIANYFRPSHADFTFDEKFGFRDYRGGGRSSGRETAARVAAGSVAKLLLKEIGINILTYTYSIGNIEIDENNFDEKFILENNLNIPDKQAFDKIIPMLDKCLEEHDSMGGSIMCKINGMPAGVGEPVFEKLNAKLAHAIFSIGAVKGFEFGGGINSSKIKGSENNDEIIGIENFKNNSENNSKLIKNSNNSGGTLGGMSDGCEIFFRIYIKPTPSISKTQKTIDKEGNPIEISIKGRHDPLIVPRAVIVVEAMSAITIADLLLQNLSSKIDSVKKIYI